MSLVFRIDKRAFANKRVNLDKIPLAEVPETVDANFLNQKDVNQEEEIDNH